MTKPRKPGAQRQPRETPAPPNFLALFDAVPGALIVARVEDGRILHVNPAGAAIVGRPAAELVGQPLQAAIPGAMTFPAEAAVTAPTDGARLIPPHEVPLTRPDATVVTVQVSGAVVQSGADTLAMVHLRDVGGVDPAQRLLRETQDLYKALVESAADPIFVFGRNGRFQSVNAAAGRHFRGRPEDLIGRTMHEVFPPPVADRHWAVVRQVFDTGVPVTSDEGPVDFPIGRRWFNTTLVPIKDERGEVRSVVGIARDITERRLAEEAHRQSEERYRELVDNMNDGLFVVDLEGRHQYVNRAVVDRSGIPAETFLKSTYFETLPPEEAAKVARIYARIAQGEAIASFELSYIKRDGQKVDIEVRPQPIRVDGRVVAIQNLSQDISSRKRAEEALRASERKYRDLMDNTDDGVFSLDAEGRFTFVNRTIASGAGLPAEQFAALHGWDIVVPEDRDRLHAKFDRVMRGEKVERFEVGFVGVAGQRVIIEVIPQPILDGDRIVGVQGAIRDVTAYRQTEVALRESREQLQAVYDAAADGILIVDAATLQVVGGNRGLRQMFGYSDDELMAMTAPEFRPPGSASRIGMLAAQLAPGQSVVDPNVDMVRKGGSAFSADISLSQLRYQGRPCLLAVIRDATDRRRAEAALRESEARYRAVVETQNEIITRFFPDGTLTFVNEACCRLLGRTRDQLVGRAIFDLMPDDVRRQTRQCLAGITPASPVAQHSHPIVAPSGETRWVEWIDRGLFDDAGRLVEFQTTGRDITEARLAQQALRESEEKHRALIETTDTGYVIVDREGRVLDANAEYVRLTGHEALADILGRTVMEWTADHDRARNADEVRRCLECGSVRNLDVDYVGPQGGLTPVEINATVMPSADGIRIVSLVRDITDRKRAEQALRQSEATYQAIFQGVSDALFVQDVKTGEVLAINRRVTELYGYGPDELDALNADRRQMPDGPYSFKHRRELQLTVAQGKAVSYEWLARHKDGHRFWVELNSSLATIGGRACILAAVRDISRRKVAEEALREREQELRDVIENMPDGLTVIDLVTERFISTNRSVCRMLGRSEAEILACSVQDLAPTNLREDAIEANHQHLLRGESVISTGVELVRKDGTTFLADVSNTPIVFRGRPCSLSIVSDTTERHRAAEALRRSEENYRMLFEQNILGISVLVDGRYVKVNEALTRIYRRKPEEFIGLRVGEFALPDGRERARRRFGLVVSGGTDAGQYQIVRPDGSIGCVEIQSFRTDWEGRPAVLAMYQDVTDQRRMEEELREAHKMEAVGQLAGGIAHDFNNLMTGILCNAGLLKDTADSPADVRETAAIIEGAARRAAQLTGQLLGFARRGKHQVTVVDLSAAIETSVSLLARTFDSSIAVEMRPSADPACVLGDPAQMEQVILNLAMNARDAMPDGGRLTFSTEIVQRSDADGPRPAWAEPGRYVLATVRDTGVGIPVELHSRIFEPFFTTKPRGKGTGMGLAMVYGIVRHHGGWVEVDSAAGAGATFRIFLPLATEPEIDRVTAAARTPDEAATPGAATAGGLHASTTDVEKSVATKAAGTSAAAPLPGSASPLRILVVDDEEIVRSVLARMLTAMGYVVVTAADGREAVAIYRRLGPTIDIVIIDMVMPVMGGSECFRALRGLNPAVRAILSTGGGAEGAPQVLLDEGMVGFVLKPFQAEHLAAAVRKALGR